MGILNFNKPEKIRTTEEHNGTYQSDAGVDGTYVPNMSREAMCGWKAKHIRGENERVEIRKSIGGTQILIIVYKDIQFTPWNVDRSKWAKNHQNIQISMNGKIDMEFHTWGEMQEAVAEAKGILLIEDINKNL